LRDQHGGENQRPTGYSNTGDLDEFAAALNLGGKLFDVHLLVGITIV